MYKCQNDNGILSRDCEVITPRFEVLQQVHSTAREILNKILRESHVRISTFTPYDARA